MAPVDCPRIIAFSQICYYLEEDSVGISEHVKLHLLHQIKSIHLVVLKVHEFFAIISLPQSTQYLNAYL